MENIQITYSKDGEGLTNLMTSSEDVAGCAE